LLTYLLFSNNYQKNKKTKKQKKQKKQKKTKKNKKKLGKKWEIYNNVMDKVIQYLARKKVSEGFVVEPGYFFRTGVGNITKKPVKKKSVRITPSS